ncbi:MAG TPA: IS1634 family transposase [Longimicrobium sp.]|jgi:transposase|uniref:IS1634 family transposase n=1 Tax=Longimicrobium sp. TaxID=2029185 RepID=UPI002ED7853A
MYLREVVSTRKRGPDTRYLQLVEGERDAQGRVQTRILHSFGRTDQLDIEQIRRLVEQLSRYLDPAASPAASGLEVTRTWTFGGTHLLDSLWRELRLDEFFSHALEARSFAQPVERAIFALVAHRALAPASKLACSRWAGASAWIPGLEGGGAELDVQHLYRAMDFLHGAMPELQEHLYFQVTDLLSADVSVLFYDTTSVSFYLDEADPEGELRRHGHSKKKRPDLPQIVVGLAINRDGIPVRHWIYPGNRIDVTTVEEVTRDLLGLRPRRFLFVGDRGMVSQANLDFLESRRLGYLLGCPIRNDPALEAHMLSLRGRYSPVCEGLGVKETRITDGGRTLRYLLCRSEARAEHDARTRATVLERLKAKLAKQKKGKGADETRDKHSLLSTPGYARYLVQDADGKLRIDPARVAAAARHDGKYVLMTNELDLPSEELVLGYRDLWRAERAFRSMKSILDLEPVQHRTPERITSHVHVCVLAYLLVRVAESRARIGWEAIREQVERITLSELTTGRASVLQTKSLTSAERDLLNCCRVPLPPKTLQVTPA